MRKIVQHITRWVYSISTREAFFLVLLGLFVLQAAWLAFTAIYPMPFDEFTHVGAIQLYAKQWSWVITGQPLDTGIIGDLTSEPSFLYRWLMSYPYRVLDSFLSIDQAIIAMRLMNVAMVAGGIVLFRRLLREWAISDRIINIVLLAFVMTPIVPFLAAHVNYDNLMFLLTPIVLLYAGRLIKGNDRLVGNLALFMLVGGVTVLAKQTFLPIMGILVVYIGYILVRRNGSKLPGNLKQSWASTPKNITFYIVATGFLVVGVLAGERYIGNLVQYGTFRPSCEAVQPVEFCEDNGPWYRNNVANVENRPSEPPYGNPLSFSQYWVTRMMRGYFAAFQHTPTQGATEREPYGPIVVRPLLPVQINIAITIAFIGIFAVFLKRKQIGRNQYLRFALVIVLGFIAVQWAYNYSGYLKMWKAEAIQARYTYPLMILIFTLIAWSLSKLIASRQTKAVMVVALFIFYVWGGGIAGWLIRADDTWRWQHPLTQSINHSVQTVLRFTVIH